jgi:hypothetical protein
MCFGQEPLQVDTTFRLTIQEKGASSILPLEDGSVIVSGELKFPGNWWTNSLARFNADGTTFEPFYLSNLGGGRITPWEDRFYVGTSQTVRRILISGVQDPTFIEMNFDPLFLSLQGGDYHVYPDGRVLMSGAHELLDTARGFTGLYNLIWFTNTGHVDTTKVHRKGNQVLGEIEPLPDGGFLVHGTCTEYEGHPVGRVFRIHADGSLDTTFQTTMNWGDVVSFLPIADGRFYAAGIYRLNGFPDDTLRLARFHPNGDLDSTFSSPHFQFQGQSNPGGLGPPLRSLQFTEEGDLLVTGGFQLVNGESRKGLCVVDTNGTLQETFANAGVGRYYYMGFPSAIVGGYLPMENGMAYIWGAYHGYNDGSTNDTLQRFVTRLYEPDVTTPVVEETPLEKRFSTYPNPAENWVTFRYRFDLPPTNAFVTVKDPLGREIASLPMTNAVGQLVFDTRDLANGMYTVSYTAGGRPLKLDKLVVR